MIMKQLHHLWALVALLSVLLVGCKPEETRKPAVESECTFTIEAPVGLKDATYSDLQVTIKGSQDGKEIALKPESATFHQKLLEGKYQVSLTAGLSYQSDRLGKVRTTVSMEESIVVKGEKSTFTLIPQYTENVSSGFVIEELFISPTYNPETKKSYTYGEQYIKITNNSDVTLYADGLGIAQSALQCNMKQDYVDKDAIKEILPVGFLSIIPGDGTTYPVKPGASIVIANDARDHSKVFPGAVDLSHANFEIYDLSSNPKFQDTDNPEVPNLISYYKSSRTVSSFHQAGCTTIALVRVPVDVATYEKDYAWSAKYLFRFKDFVKEMETKAYKVPHAWIVDAVFLGIKDKIDWRYIPDTIDAGFTGWRDSFQDNTGQGTAVIRKVEREANGRKYLKDTNNSTEDFEARVQPSLKAGK